MTLSYETLTYSLDGNVATITLNRPEKKNAMSWPMFEELSALFDAIPTDDEVRCVVVTGAGGNFCTGADLSDPSNAVTSPIEMSERMAFMNALVRKIVRCPKPTIARVEGVAAGAGCNFALACDFVVAAEDARFIEIFVKRGLVVDFGGTWLLTRALPLGKAKELAMLGEEFSGTEAHRIGLATRAVPAAELDTAVKEFTGRLTALPPRTLSLLKANLNRAADSNLEAALADEEAAQILCITSQDTMEAVSAFLQKREPHFTGK